MAFTLAGFSPLRRLGSGGFADVFEATDPSGRRVAVKKSRTPMAPRFAREAAALRRLGGTVAPALYDHLVDEDTGPVLVMELVPGRAVEPAGRAASELLGLLERVATAVDTMHAARVVHRDLKPDNLVERDDGRVVILDFGLARLDGDDAGATSLDADLVSTRARELLGTPSYMSPEQWRGQRADAAADRYSLAIVAYELLAGQLPFIGDLAEVQEGHVARQPPRFAAERSLPAAVDDVIRRGLAKAPQDRFETAASFIAALRVAMAAGAAPARRDEASAERRPIVVAALETDARITEVSDAVERERGVILGALPGGYLAAYPAAVSLARGVLHARRSIDRLAPAASAVHVVEARVSHGRRGVRVSGVDADDVARWWPRDSDRNPHLTARAREHDTAIAVEPIDAASLPLRGRDELVAALLAAGAGAVASGAPVLTTVLGTDGLGKSRLVDAVAGDALRARSAESLAAALGVDVSAGDAHGWPGAVRQKAARALALGLVARARRAPVTVIVDDAHRVDYALLDALEQATSSEVDAPVRVVVAAHPQLLELRPHWGHRAARHAVYRLGPLDPEAFRELVVDLLTPVEYVPAATVDLLADMTGRVPRAAVDLVSSLRERGAVHRIPGTASWVVRADELVHDSASSLEEHVAREVLAAMPPALQSLAQLCAAAGPATVSVITAASARGDLTALDPSVGLARLAHLGVVSVRDGRCAFVREAVRRGVQTMTPIATARRMHEALLDEYEQRGSRCADAARHALHSGRRQRAAELYLDLAEQHARAFRFVEAEQCFATALDQLDRDDTERRARALGRRGVMRQSLGRHAEALADVDRALALATDDRALAALHLERAGVLDWMARFADSAAAVERAAPFVDRVADERLRARHGFAQGRSAARRNDFAAALPLLATAIQATAAGGDAETEVDARVTLSIALVFAGKLDDAERAFADTIARCEQLGDRFHLCVAHNNRIFLWMQRGDLQRARSEAERSVELAIEVGYFLLERSAYNNLAELLLWLGDEREALRLATRARELSERYGAPDPELSILIARIHAAAGRPDLANAARSAVANDYDVLTPSQQILVRAVELACAGAELSPEWPALLASAATRSVLHERLEIEHLYATTALRQGRSDVAASVASEAAARPGCPSAWKARFEALIVDSDGGP